MKRLKLFVALSALSQLFILKHSPATAATLDEDWKSNALQPGQNAQASDRKVQLINRVDTDSFQSRHPLLIAEKHNQGS